MGSPVESQPPDAVPQVVAQSARGSNALPPSIPVATPVEPLTEAHYALLRRAAALRRPVRRAVRTARASAFSMLAVGVAGIPVSLMFPDRIGVLVVGLICVLGLIEWIGARRLRQGIPSAAVLLGINQLCLLTAIVAYCTFRIASFSDASVRAALGSAEMESQLSQVPGLEHQIQELAPAVTYLLYGSVIVLSVALQGGLAIYYFTRQRHLKVLAQATPPWIRRVFAVLGE